MDILILSSNDGYSVGFNDGHSDIQFVGLEQQSGLIGGLFTSTNDAKTDKIESDKHDWIK